MVSAKHAFAAPPRFRGIGWNHLHAELTHRAPQLRRTAPIHRAVGLGRAPVVRTAVGVQARRLPPSPEDLGQAPRVRRGAFLLDEIHRIMLRGRVVQRDDKVPLSIKIPPWLVKTTMLRPPEASGDVVAGRT